MTSKLAKEQRPGLTNQCIKACMKTAKNMGRELSSTQTDQLLLGHACKIQYQDKGITCGQMGGSIQECGTRIKCTAKVLLSGQMAASIQENMSMNANMATENSIGQMAAFTKVTGKMENKKDQEHFFAQTVSKSNANGKTERDTEKLTNDIEY